MKYLAALFVFSTFSLQGQVITGSLTDQTGAPLPGARVEALNTQTGTTASTISNDSGSYRFAGLAPGKYRVSASLTGFTTTSRASELNVSQTLALDLTLGVEEVSTALNVEASAPLTDSQSSSVGQLVSRAMVTTLPMPKRAATALVTLAPGTVMIDSGQGAENYPVFSIAGGRARNQNFILDGANVTNAVGLTRPQQMTSLPLDAMQEFRVISNSYAAEYGHSTGGIIALSTRSGSNEFHGSVFDYARNAAFDARNFFAAAKPPLKLQQFGGSLGGPIRKDKTHFFFTWEETRQTSATTVLTHVPTLAERNGDFSGLATIYDPATTVGRARQPFAGNRIPLDRFDPVAKAALAYWPLPNRVGANNYGGNNNSVLNRDIYVARVDHQFRPADQASFRYYVNSSFIDNQGAYGIGVADPDAGTNDARIDSILGSHTHVFSPSVINELKVTFLQRKFIDQRFGSTDKLPSSLGLAGVSDAAFPTLTIPGYALLGGNGSVSRIQTPIRDTQVLESISLVRGTHAWKAGVEFRAGRNTETRDRSSAGSFGFTQLITGLPGVSGTGNPLASFLLGEVNSASVLVSDQITSRASYWAAFVQDDWRVTNRLTLNYGLRWEVEMPRYVDGDRQNSFDPYAINPVSGTPGVVTFSGRNGLSRRAFAPDYNNFGPRLGIAYRLGGKHETVLRAGAGIFYGPTVSNTIGDAATLGFSTTSSLVTAQADLNSAMQLRNGVPVIPRAALDASFGAVPLGQRPVLAVSYFDPNQKAPISYQYNANIQHEVARDLLLEVGYIANVSHHLTANDLSLNQVPPALMGAGDAQQRRPFPQFSNVTLINPAIGNSTYHGGYVKLERRFASGFSALAHYTWSKFIDDVASSNEYGDGASYMDAYNRRLDKGLSGSDVPQRTVLSLLYEVPRFPALGRWASLARAWKFGVLGTWQSGGVFTVVTAANTTNAFPAGPIRPDLAGNPALDNGGSLTHYFNTSAFVAPAAIRFGSAPRSVLRGPFQQTVDLTLAREFAATERLKLEFRGEAYNALNHTNFDVPGHTLGTADFGVISSARPARTVQIGLRVGF